MTNCILFLALFYFYSCYVSSASSTGSLLQADYPLMNVLQNGKWADKSAKQQFLQWFFYRYLMPSNINDLTTFSVEKMVTIDMKTLQSHGYQLNSQIYWSGPEPNWLLKIVFTNANLRQFRDWILNDPALDVNFKCSLTIDIFWLMSAVFRNIHHPPISQQDMHCLFKVFLKNNNQEISRKIIFYYLIIVRESDDIRKNKSSLVQHGAIDYIQLLTVWKYCKAPTAIPQYLNAIITTIENVLLTHTTHNPYCIHLPVQTIHAMIRLFSDKTLIYFDTALAHHIGARGDLKALTAFTVLTDDKYMHLRSTLNPQHWRYIVDMLWVAFVSKINEIMAVGGRDGLVTFIGKTFIYIYGSMYSDMVSVETSYALMIRVDKVKHSKVVSSPIFYAVLRKWIYILERQEKLWHELLRNPQCRNWRIWPLNLWKDVKIWFANTTEIRHDFYRVLQSFIVFFNTIMNETAVTEVAGFFSLHYPAQYAYFLTQMQLPRA